MPNPAAVLLLERYGGNAVPEARGRQRKGDAHVGAGLDNRQQRGTSCLLFRVA